MLTNWIFHFKKEDDTFGRIVNVVRIFIVPHLQLNKPKQLADFTRLEWDQGRPMLRRSWRRGTILDEKLITFSSFPKALVQGVIIFNRPPFKIYS